jgi:hypothetical protein
VSRRNSFGGSGRRLRSCRVDIKTITLQQFLTPGEIARARALWRELKDTDRFVPAVAREIIGPQLARINAALGQDNNPRYLAYAVEDEFSTTDRATPGYLWERAADTCKVCGKHLGAGVRFLHVGVCETCGKTRH